MSAVTDLKSRISILNAIASQSLTGSALVGDIIDTSPGNSVTFVINSSGLSDNSQRILLLEQSEDGIVFKSVDQERLNPVDFDMLIKSETPEIITFATTQTDRYLRLTITEGLATATAISSVAILGSLLHIN